MMDEPSREFQIFIKPVGSVCNLSCDYCYYLDKEKLYKGKRNMLMEEDLLEKYIIRHIEASAGN
jgi:uncharacterized protein